MWGLFVCIAVLPCPPRTTVALVSLGHASPPMEQIESALRRELVIAVERQDALPFPPVGALPSGAYPSLALKEAARAAWGTRKADKVLFIVDVPLDDTGPIAGVAELGGRSAIMTTRRPEADDTAVHEVGHLLGLGHHAACVMAERAAAGRYLCARCRRRLDELWPIPVPVPCQAERPCGGDGVRRIAGVATPAQLV
jgi:hypothetical protein